MKPCLHFCGVLLLCKGWRELALLAVRSWASLLHSRGLPVGCNRSWQLPDSGRWTCSLPWLCCKLPSGCQESLLYSKEFGVWHLQPEPVRFACETTFLTHASTAMILERQQRPYLLNLHVERRSLLTLNRMLRRASSVYALAAQFLYDRVSGCACDMPCCRKELLLFLSCHFSKLRDSCMILELITPYTKQLRHDIDKRAEAAMPNTCP